MALKWPPSGPPGPPRTSSAPLPTAVPLAGQCQTKTCQVGLECVPEVKTGGEGRARGAEIWGKRQVPGPERLPSHPGRRAFRLPPRGAPHSPPLFTLQLVRDALFVLG